MKGKTCVKRVIAVLMTITLTAELPTAPMPLFVRAETLTNDLIKPRIKNFDDKHQVMFMRIFIAVFLVVSVFIACCCSFMFLLMR